CSPPQNGHRVYLESLEPYILNGKLRTLSPEVISALVDHCQRGGDLARAEQVVLCLQTDLLDVESLLAVLRRHRLHTSLLH
ncbi:unnamed protein product, partial [Discosporangium mesarthrocarpum]